MFVACTIEEKRLLLWTNDELLRRQKVRIMRISESMTEARRRLLGRGSRVKAEVFRLRLSLRWPVTLHQAKLPLDVFAGEAGDSDLVVHAADQHGPYT